MQSNPNEKEIIWLDGKLLPFSEAKVHVLTHALHYGSGVFEGIRSYDVNGQGAVFRLEDHTKRLLESAKIYCMQDKISYSVSDLNRFVLDTLKANKLTASYIRPLFFRGMGAGGVRSLGLNPLKNVVQLMIAAFAWGPYLGKDAFEKGIAARFSSWQRPRQNTLPALSKASGNYLNSQLVQMEAYHTKLVDGADFKEGIAMDAEGYISEGAGENIFVVKDKVLYTPPFFASLLPGITRDSVMQIAKWKGIKVLETRMPREFLYLADEVFMVGTAAEITPVVQIDHHKVGDGKRGEITQEIQSCFFGIVEGKEEDRWNWLTLF